MYGQTLETVVGMLLIGTLIGLFAAAILWLVVDDRREQDDDEGEEPR